MRGRAAFPPFFPRTTTPRIYIRGREVINAASWASRTGYTRRTWTVEREGKGVFESAGINIRSSRKGCILSISLQARAVATRTGAVEGDRWSTLPSLSALAVLAQPSAYSTVSAFAHRTTLYGVRHRITRHHTPHSSTLSIHSNFTLPSHPHTPALIVCIPLPFDGGISMSLEARI